jgi:hypothetical protein
LKSENAVFCLFQALQCTYDFYDQTTQQEKDEIVLLPRAIWLRMQTSPHYKVWDRQVSLDQTAAIYRLIKSHILFRNRTELDLLAQSIKEYYETQDKQNAVTGYVLGK